MKKALPIPIRSDETDLIHTPLEAALHAIRNHSPRTTFEPMCPVDAPQSTHTMHASPHERLYKMLTQIVRNVYQDDSVTYAPHPSRPTISLLK